jgi:hypothetical protein
VRYRGPHTDYAVDVAAGTVWVREPGPTSRRVGDSVGISIHRTWSLSPATGKVGVRNDLLGKPASATGARP